MLFGDNVNEIIPGLWLGNAYSAHDKQFLKNNNITVIINCTKDIPFTNEKGFAFYRIPVDDSLKEKDIILMEQSLSNVLEYLLCTHKYGNRNVLVHCFAGVQRSAIVVVSYLFLLQIRKNHTINYSQNGINTIIQKEKEKEAKNVFKYTINKRPQAFFGGRFVNFQKSFENYFNVKLR